ncbi:DNA gyrase subunit A [Acanthopleuribacter pedis]|uniref:DNA gyrase subunit A n=1 Tax=Acanthopleuribacter pedis TaxID=442870 RepID=A0A8J7U180_9BACT|nr:DNA gyrase subunit A [Acanthopleuribacter pedis]MBO1317883.1 DNA gyrase subunit A [Acanthopleuribacter pedis]
MNSELPVNITREMRQSYLDYSMSVIVGRALPDVRDGFKPVHRRILYAMFREGLLSNRKYSKCAGVVGEVLKKYHPHGDSAVYDALVRLAQPWNMRYQLVDGQGNFGSIDGDRAAAYRYTEARMQQIAEEMLNDIDKETVDWQPNFDETVNEPLVLPTRYPNLLVNGSSGIAVGMATNVPPHHLGEVTDGLLMLLDNPDATIDELMTVIKGPDFPTGGMICGTQGIYDAYHTGKGRIIVRAKTHFEENEGRTWIIVDEIPYMVNKAKVCEKIAELVKDQKIDGISELRDESDRHGMRIVVELKRNEVPEVVLNKLYQMTALQSTFGVIMLALVDNQPKILNLRQILGQFIAFRRDVVIRRTSFLLRKAEERSHILEGLVKALDLLDEIIALIRAAESPSLARAQMVERWEFSVRQAQAILEMRLQKLTGMERQAIVNEYNEIQEVIRKLRLILDDPNELLRVIREETQEVRDRYVDDRRTEIRDMGISFTVEDFIADESVVITCSHRGYIKQTPLTIYKEQKRGGKGRLGMRTHDDDFVEYMFVAQTHDYLMVFTNFGKVYWIKVHQIPQTDAANKGKAIVNLIGFEDGERAVAFNAVREFSDDVNLVFATRKGLVKRTVLSAFKNIRANGIRAISIQEGDELINVRQTTGESEIFLASKLGKAIRFAETEVRQTGRSSMGVTGIRLSDGDTVVEMAVINEDSGSILTISELGYGKRTLVSEYRLQGRGGFGSLNMKKTDKTGSISGVRYIKDHDSVLIISQLGKLIRLDLTTIRDIGRVTQGVRLIQLDDPSDRVVGIGLVPKEEESDEALEEILSESEAALEETGSEAGDGSTEQSGEDQEQES